MHPRSVTGPSNTPILVFLGIVGLSAIFFLIFTGGTPMGSKRPDGSPALPSGAVTAVTSGGAQPGIVCQ